MYLDNSDFSKLSAPRGELSQENQKILGCLREHKRAGTASFFMSAVHLSEAVHAAESYKPAAIRRAELMRELCGSNTLRLPIDLPSAELNRLLSGNASGRLPIGEIRSEPGSWFGAHVSLDSIADNREKKSSRAS